MKSINITHWGGWILISLCIAAAFSLSSCKKDKPTVPPAPQKIPINVSTSVWSKATDSGYEENDRVGLFVVNWSDGAPQQLQTGDNYLWNGPVNHHAPVMMGNRPSLGI